MEVNAHELHSCILGLMECCYSAQCVEGTSQQVECYIVGKMKCVILNSMCI